METQIPRLGLKINAKKLVIFALIFFAVVLLAQTVFYAFQYSVVYFRTGDIYFGRFLPFPFNFIFDTWILQRDGNGQVFLVKAQNMIWKPLGFIHLNPEEIVFFAPLSRQSQVWKTIDLGKNSSEPVLIQ